MKQKPKYLLIFKIVGFIGIALGVFGLILTFVGFGDFESNHFMIGGFLTAFGLFIGVFGLVNGFKPEISKMSTQTSKYIQEQNKEDLTDMANTSVEIYEEAVTRMAGAVREGLTEETIYCKHCGAKIDADSKFCSQCGKEL